MAKTKKNQKHRTFWFIVKLQIVLMTVVLAGMFYYNFGGYATKIQ